MTHTLLQALWRQKQESGEFEARLSYTVVGQRGQRSMTLSQKKGWGACIVLGFFCPNTQETEAGRAL